MPRQSSHVIVPASKPTAKAQKPRDPVASGERDAAFNRSATYNYFLVEKIEAGVSLRGSLYSAPELILEGERPDARADLFGFGAMVYALLMGRELTDLD